jgi:transcriptional regulator with XRE-family HTH domain
MINKKEVCELFGELLSRRRSEAKLSQRDFGKAVGLSRTSITNIEQGRQPVSLPTLYVMADVLRRDVADLLPRISPTSSQSTQSLSLPTRKQLKNLSGREINWLNKIARGTKLGKAIDV